MTDPAPGADIALSELFGGVVPEHEAPEPDAPRRWVVIAMVDDGAVALVLTEDLDGYRDSTGPPIVVAVPGNRVTLVALQQALEVWRRDDGLYRYSAPVEALCDALRELNALEHRAAVAASSEIAMDVARWWTATRT